MMVERFGVKNVAFFFDKEWISTEILRYLMDHPDSKDTLEGIVEWWLFERRISFISAKVEEALAELSSEGYIIVRRGTDSKDYYRLNQDRMNSIRELLDRMEAEKQHERR